MRHRRTSCGIFRLWIVLQCLYYWANAVIWSENGDLYIPAIRLTERNRGLIIREDGTCLNVTV